jgi:hypothetical protein
MSGSLAILVVPTLVHQSFEGDLDAVVVLDFFRVDVREALPYVRKRGAVLRSPGAGKAWLNL